MKGFVKSMISIVDFYVGGVREKGEKILDTITASDSGESLEGTPPIEEQVDTFLDDLAEGASKIKKDILSNIEPHISRSLEQKSMTSILTRNTKLREILTSNGILRVKNLDVEE
jgi:ABC-type sugar transport system substrate-binding protein